MEVQLSQADIAARLICMVFVATQRWLRPVTPDSGVRACWRGQQYKRVSPRLLRRFELEWDVRAAGHRLTI
ncbi:hypothetical protein BRL76_20400, partial [Xanthomonas oryzae pv. oryzae]